MKKTIIIASILALIGLVGFTLKANKDDMKEKAELAVITSDAIPVEVATVKAELFQQQHDANGTFHARHDLTVVSETQGKIIEMLKVKGDQVAKGETIAVVDSELAQADLAAAKAQYDKMKLDMDRFSNLKHSDAITARQLEDVKLAYANAEAQYKAAAKRMENTRIVAPISGVINEDFAQLGTFLSPGMQIAEIVDLRKLNLNVKVSESTVIELERGQKITISTDLYPTQTLEGKIIAIAAKADGAMKYEVEIEVTNPEKTPLKAGMYGVAHFTSADADASLFMERSALVGSLKNPKAFVTDGQTAQLKDITIGRVLEDKVEILQGLEEGQQVVTNGQINLKDGTRVNTL